MNPDLAKSLATAAMTLMHRGTIQWAELDAARNVQQFLYGISQGQYVVLTPPTEPLKPDIAVEPLVAELAKEARSAVPE